MVKEFPTTVFCQSNLLKNVPKISGELVSSHYQFPDTLTETHCVLGLCLTQEKQQGLLHYTSGNFNEAGTNWEEPYKSNKYCQDNDG